MSSVLQTTFGGVVATDLTRTGMVASTGVAGASQTAAISFSRSSSANFDATAKISDAGLSSSSTSLSLSLALQANRKYSFSFYYPYGGPKVTLVDAKRKKTLVNMATGFTVKKSGNYTLQFDAAYSLKSAAQLDRLEINAKSVLPTSSGNSKVDALLMGGTNNWWHDWNSAPSQGGDAIGGASGLVAGSSARTITFGFLSSQPGGQSMTGFQEMTAAQKSAVRRAFAQYGKLINVTFSEVTGDGAANINFGTNSQASSAGYAMLPNSSGVKDKTYLYLANNQATNNDAGMADGGYGYLTVLHEIGHTLGLKHPGNYNAGGGGTPAPYLPSNEDNHQKTIMAYTDNEFSRGVNASSPMLYDVAALQYLYGANRNSSTATSGAFTFSSVDRPLKTLWSVNGTDTIDLSATTNASNVNLNAGSYSSINVTGPASSSSYSGNQNVAIAYGSNINRVNLSTRAGVADSVTLNAAFSGGSFDTIASFDAAVDRINLRSGLFGSLTTSHIQIGTNSVATGKDSRIIVNTTTGEIFYDADGVKTKKAAKKIAQYFAIAGGGLALTASNFNFVA